MKTVKLKFIGINSKLIPNISIDDQYVKCKKNDFGSYEATVETEKEEIKLAFTRDLELKAKLWWLYAIISFIVSIFGILDPPYDRKCISMNCLFNIKLNQENNITIRFNTLTSNGKAVELETENSFEEINNEYKIDKTAKKRWIALLVIKIVCWIGMAIFAGWLIANKII